ncbi:MAG: hypothetical protein QM831_11365 [Kofleriaceae bacterium]
MTAKRDLKRRVRDRQAKTGESYTAALRHVRAAEAEPTTTPISVDALVDITTAATDIGLRCKVLVSEALAARVPPARLMVGLREVLLATGRDPAMHVLCAIGFHGDASSVPTSRSIDPRQTQFLAQLRAGVGGIAASGRALGFHLDGTAIVCSVWRRDPTLVLCMLDDAVLLTLSGLGTVARALGTPRR